MREEIYIFSLTGNKSFNGYVIIHISVFVSKETGEFLLRHMYFSYVYIYVHVLQYTCVHTFISIYLSKMEFFHMLSWTYLSVCSVLFHRSHATKLKSAVFLGAKFSLGYVRRMRQWLKDFAWNSQFYSTDTSQPCSFLLLSTTTRNGSNLNILQIMNDAKCPSNNENVVHFHFHFSYTFSYKEKWNP